MDMDIDIIIQEIEDSLALIEFDRQGQYNLQKTIIVY